MKHSPSDRRKAAGRRTAQNARGTITLVNAVNGGTITGSPLQPDTDAQLSIYPGWHVRATSSSVTLRKDGMSIFIR